VGNEELIAIFKKLAELAPLRDQEKGNFAKAALNKVPLQSWLTLPVGHPLPVYTYWHFYLSAALARACSSVGHVNTSNPLSRVRAGHTLVPATSCVWL
jgi:hypothetical protein